MVRPLVKADLKLEGMTELKAFLREFGDEITQGTLLDNACAAGAKVLQTEIDARSPSKRVRNASTVRKGRGAVKGLRLSVSSEINGIAVVGFKAPHYPLVHLIEFGTSQRTQKTTGRKTGRMPARPFVRPAVDSATQDVERAMARNLRSGIKRDFGKVFD